MQDDGTCLLYIDRHLVHEVTSPQAFEGLRTAPQGSRAGKDAGRRRSQRADLAGPLRHQDEESRIQVDTLAKNAADFGIDYYNEVDIRQGIVHIVGPSRASPCPA
jgi:3-isopropylmalate/(R)-2-methylmalate dehydratase large subunit